MRFRYKDSLTWQPDASQEFQNVEKKMLNSVEAYFMKQSIELKKNQQEVKESINNLLDFVRKNQKASP